MVDSEREPYWLEDFPEFFDPPQKDQEVWDEIRGRGVLDYHHNGFNREFSNVLGHFIYSKDGHKITNARELHVWLNSPANKKKLGFQHFTFSPSLTNISLTSSRGLRPGFRDTEMDLWRYQGSEQQLKRRAKKGFISDEIEEIFNPDESPLQLLEFNSICKFLGRKSKLSEEVRIKEDNYSEEIRRFLETGWLQKDYKISQNAKALLLKNQPVCCSCADSCFTERCPCRQKTRLGAEDWNRKTLDSARKISDESLNGYDRHGLLHELLPAGIYECGKNCTCDPTKCTQRISQKGLTQQVEVRRTVKQDEYDCGMAVYAMSPVPKGTFITRYLGELITKDEEKMREDEAKEKAQHEENRNGNFGFNPESAAHKRVSYNCDLSSSYKPGALTNQESFDLVVDAMNYGNLGRFFNHRCKYPNLFVQLILVDQTPYFAFFVKDVIKSNIVSDQFDDFIGTGSQLTWNYGPQYSDKDQQVRMFGQYCQCEDCMDED